MPFELIYTSAPRGLKAGTFGFSTVAKTKGTPPQVATSIEALSVFRGSAPNDFASFSQLFFKIGDSSFLVLSRIADAGLDYSGRSNFIAHHWAFGEAEAAREKLNPTAFWESERDFFLRNWGERNPEVLDQRDWTAARRQTLPQRCDAWKEATGDAGWGAVFAATAIEGSRVSLIVPPQIDPTVLFWEALSLVPPQISRTVSFASTLSQVPFGVELNWRGIWAGTPEEASARLASSRGELIFDASEPGRVSVFPRCSKPEDAAAFLASDTQFGERVDAARRGVDDLTKRSVLHEDVRDVKFDDSDSVEARDSNGRLTMRRVAVPSSESSLKKIDEDDGERVNLRRLRSKSRALNDGKKMSGFNDDWTENDGSGTLGFVENDQKNADTERLNEIYLRLAQEGAEKQVKRCRTTLYFWGVGVAILIGVFFAFHWVLQKDVPESVKQPTNTTKIVPAKLAVEASSSPSSDPEKREPSKAADDAVEPAVSFVE